MVTNKPMRILFLDDRSKRIMSAIKRWYEKQDLVIVTTARETMKMITLHEWDLISLDYDLGFEEFTPAYLPGNGMEIIRYIRENVNFFKTKMQLPKIIVHSANPAAGSKMVDSLKELDFEAYYERWQYD